jgi:hypothetical protein
MSKVLPLGCFMFEGQVSSFSMTKLPPAESLMSEIRTHLSRKMGIPVYYRYEFTPHEILAKVEHYQVGVRDLVRSLKEQAQVVQSLCTLLEMVKREEEEGGEG